MTRKYSLSPIWINPGTEDILDHSPVYARQSLARFLKALRRKGLKRIKVCMAAKYFSNGWYYWDLEYNGEKVNLGVLGVPPEMCCTKSLKPIPPRFYVDYCSFWWEFAVRLVWEIFTKKGAYER